MPFYLHVERMSKCSRKSRVIFGNNYRLFPVPGKIGVEKPSGIKLQILVHRKNYLIPTNTRICYNCSFCCQDKTYLSQEISRVLPCRETNTTKKSKQELRRTAKFLPGLTIQSIYKKQFQSRKCVQPELKLSRTLEKANGVISELVKQE